MSKLLIDIGSTYFKVAQEGRIDQYFRNFDTSILNDLESKCAINIISTLLYPKITEPIAHKEMIDVVIVVGGIDSAKQVFDEKLMVYLREVNYQNIVFAGSQKSSDFLKSKIPSDEVIRVLMHLSMFLVLYKVSKHHASYVELNLEILNSIVLTEEDVDDIIHLLYCLMKIMRFGLMESMGKNNYRSIIWDNQ